MTKVLLVLGSSTGGVGQHVHSLAAGLAARGHNVTVAAPAEVDELFGFDEVGARFIPVAISDRVRDLVAVRALRPWVVSADIVHAHGFRAGLVSSMSARTSPPLVVTWHNQVLATGLRASVLRRLEAVVARRATVTLGASTDLVERAKLLGARARLGPVAAPTVGVPTRDAQQVRQELGAGDRPLLLAVGRLHPQKDYPTMFDALNLLRARRPVPHLVVVGDGPLAGELVRQVDRESLPVDLLGRRKDVTNLMAAADLLVLTSVWEARALVVQEAMELGLPVVATAVGGIPELAQGAVRLVPAGDAVAVAAAIGDLLDDPQESARLAAAGVARASSWPSEDDVVEQIEQLYRDLLETPR